MFKALFTWAYIFTHLVIPAWSPTLMLTGVAALILAAPPRVTVCFSVTTSFPDLPNVNPHSLAPVLNLNIVVLPMLSLKLAGYATYFSSFIFQFAELLWYIVIMLVSFTCLVILLGISALNILRWTSILFEKR